MPKSASTPPATGPFVSTRRALSRRRFLRGAGILLSLPWLDAMQPAFAALVNYHHHLPLSQVWGSGMLSSSDGQRFPVSGKNRLARPLPRDFAYATGVAFYSWSSDQLSQYGTKAIPATARDAPSRGCSTPPLSFRSISYN